jgi:hypothetical protein
LLKQIGQNPIRQMAGVLKAGILVLVLSAPSFSILGTHSCIHDGIVFLFILIWGLEFSRFSFSDHQWLNGIWTIVIRLISICLIAYLTDCHFVNIHLPHCH